MVFENGDFGEIFIFFDDIEFVVDNGDVFEVNLDFEDVDL